MLDDLRARALEALRPPPAVPLGDWIEATVHLPSSASAMPGAMRLWAYQRGICEALDDPDVERVTVMKSARIGYTALLTAIVGNFVANSPCPVLVVQPTTDDARDYAVETEATFEASPALRGLLSDDADPTGRSTLLARRFPGGSLKFVAARSPRSLRRHTARILVLDEIDGFEVTAEGDPVELATMRTLTFPDRKIIAGSTPIFDHGPVTRLYAQSDRRVFETPCPECDAFNVIAWKDIRWPEGRPEEAAWCCPSCGCIVDERHKPAMVAAGRWRATAPFAGHAGFAINALVSPHRNARWGVLAAEFLKAKGDPATLQTFTNLVLGESWKTEGDDLDEHELAARREPFGLANMPASALVLTVGVDCQDDRLEAVLVAHDRAGGLLVLDHQVFWGPIDGEAVWQDLDGLLRTTWPHPNGGTLRVDAAMIDAGDGGHSDRVMAFTRPRFGRRIVATKGVSGFSRPFAQRSTVKTAPLWLVGVDSAKSQLFARLERGTGIRFSADLEPVYFEMLTSERRVVRYVSGTPVARFERIPGKRAESLDATVYAWAARQLVGVNLDQREAELSTAAAPKRPTAVVRSRWLSGS